MLPPALPNNVPPAPHSRRAESDDERLRGIVAPTALSIDLVSAFAGDRPLSDDEAARLSQFQAQRGPLFFSDLLYTVTHQYFPFEVAESTWNKIIKHKRELSATLERNVHLVVATLDYLSSFTDQFHLPTLISESHIVKIVELSLYDGLTGLFNHITSCEIISLELKKSIRHGENVSLMILDIDNFKRINDESGHLEGDRILTHVATCMKAETRDSDVCCRYGGDEFTILLPFTDLPTAVMVAERIRATIESLTTNGHSVTVSIGVASCSGESHTLDSFMDKADQALYEAKQKGKNRIVAVA